MKTKILLSTALIGLSIGSVQATTLTYNATHTEANHREEHFFNITGTGDVEIVMDTLTDGLDAQQTIWKSTGTDWVFIGESPGAPRVGAAGAPEDTGFNIFGVALKNGYVKGDALQPGLTDPGAVFSLDNIFTGFQLEAGSYKVTTSGNGNFAAAGPGALESAVFWTEQDTFEIQPFFHGAHDYKFTVSGDFVTDTTVVPVPAALWLFGSAIVGLGVVRRKQNIAV